MELPLLITAILVGVAVAAPVGPVGVLCVRRTLTHGRMNGVVSSLGSAVADGVFAGVSALGMGQMIEWFEGHFTALRLIGGVFLAIFGVWTFFHRLPNPDDRRKSKGLISAATTSFVLTITNPITFVSVATIFGAFGIVGATADFARGSVLVLGVFIGSAIWWLTLSLGAGMFRGRMTDEYLLIVNRVAAVLLVGFGIFVLASLFLLRETPDLDVQAGSSAATPPVKPAQAPAPRHPERGDATGRSAPLARSAGLR